MISRNWRESFLRRLGRQGRIRFFHEYGFQFNGWSSYAMFLYKAALRGRIQREGESVVVIKGKYKGKSGKIDRTTHCKLWIREDNGNIFRVDRESALVHGEIDDSFPRTPAWRLSSVEITPRISLRSWIEWIMNGEKVRIIPHEKKCTPILRMSLEDLSRGIAEAGQTLALIESDSSLAGVSQEQVLQLMSNSQSLLEGQAPSD